MTTREAVLESASTRDRDKTMQVLDQLVGDVRPADFGFRLWDGSEWGNTNGVCTIVLTHPGSLRAMLLPPSDLTAGEAYLRGDFDVIGSAERAVELGTQIVEAHHELTDVVSLGKSLLTLPSPKSRQAALEQSASLSGEEHCKERDLEAIKHHYDIGNDFYALWLDSEMTYSCAYFQDAEQSLDDAQRAKYEHICRKLQLQPGDRLLDVGCGWGGLLRYACREYGAQGTGITLSQQQAQYANARAKEEQLINSPTVHVMDYRDAGKLGTFDKLVSVGMFEHVGAAKLPEYFGQAKDLLRPGGLFLNHGIATAELGAPPMRRKSFVGRYVFPDGQLEAISEALSAAETSGFEVRDVESLREHYAMTLRHWVSRLERNAQKAVDVTSEATYRIWRIYMAGSAYNFAKGNISVFQSLLMKPLGDVSGLPLTRSYLYD